jgi:hypothetical protein
MTKLHRRFGIPALATAIALGLFAIHALPALACGGLIAPDADVRLARATTFVAWHDGIEHYLTTFMYQETNTNSAANVGWLVPLPAVPLKIEEGGARTLQRLALETHSVQLAAFGAEDASVPPATATVLQQVKVEALNITVIKGSGQEVLNWATSNNFFLKSGDKSTPFGLRKEKPDFPVCQVRCLGCQSTRTFSG